MRRTNSGELGSLLGLTRGRDVGLVYIDGHSDFNTLETTKTGAVAGMDLALGTGRGTTELAKLRGPKPVVRSCATRAPSGWR